jgi:DNA-binding CsgD family transcriptional regulator
MVAELRDVTKRYGSVVALNNVTRATSSRRRRHRHRDAGHDWTRSRRRPARRGPVGSRDHPDDVCAARVSTNGARRWRVRYLLKDAPSAQLADAIRRVAAGGRAIDPSLAAEASTEPDPLTDRERQVLRLADEGLSGSEIARQLRLSEGTVRNYLSESIGKLGARNRSRPPAARDRKAGFRNRKRTS